MPDDLDRLAVSEEKLLAFVMARTDPMVAGALEQARKDLDDAAAHLDRRLTLILEALK